MTLSTISVDITLLAENTTWSLSGVYGPQLDADKVAFLQKLLDLKAMAPFASLKKQAETLFRLIYCARKTLFRLKKQAEKYGL